MYESSSGEEDHIALVTSAATYELRLFLYALSCMVESLRGQGHHTYYYYPTIYLHLHTSGNYYWTIANWSVEGIGLN